MVSPLGRLPVIFRKVFPYVILSFINAIIVLVLGKFVFGMPIHGNIILLLSMCLLFVITALSLGILISTVSNSQQTAMFLSMVGLMSPTILLSGFIFPVESMPKPLQFISNLITSRWFIIIIKDIMLKGLGLKYVWQHALILSGMALFFLLLSARKFQNAFAVMRVILIIIRKEFRQMFRNKSMLPVIFIMPVIQLLILSHAADFELRHIKMAVVDADKTAASRQLIENSMQAAISKLLQLK